MLLYASEHISSYLDHFGKDNVFRAIQVHGMFFSAAHRCGQRLDQDLAVNLVVMSDLRNDLELSDIHEWNSTSGLVNVKHNSICTRQRESSLPLTVVGFWPSAWK